MKDDLDTLQMVLEIFEDADIYGYIAEPCNSYVDVYDYVARVVHDKVDRDYTVVQIQRIIWDAFYDWICIGDVLDEKKRFALDKKEARPIIGEPVKFKGIALNIRDKLFGL